MRGEKREKRRLGVNYDLLKPQTRPMPNNNSNSETHFSPLFRFSPCTFLGLRGRSFFPACLQFLLYDFILSSFYAFFMPLRCGFLTLLADKSTNMSKSHPFGPERVNISPIYVYVAAPPILFSFEFVIPAALFMHYLVEATIIGCRTA